MTDPPTPIGIAVVEYNGHYLIGIRGEESPLSGYAEFPGGKCQPGESPRECALRECREETGLEVEPVELLLNRPFSYSHGRVDLHFWLSRPVEDRAVSENHQGFLWIPAIELAALKFPEANQPVVDRLLSNQASG